MNLNPNACMKSYVIMHELLHTLGLQHMHNAFDRDDFITVDDTLVDPKIKFNFNIVSPTNHSYFGTTYDLSSIMHYDRYAFGRDPEIQTIYIKVSAFIMLICIVL